MEKLEYYGILTTYNPHTKKWYAFNRNDEKHYWAGTCTKLSEGSTAEKAINNYINK